MKFILGIMLLIFTNHSFAYEVDKINTGDNLEKIAKRNLRRVWGKHSDPKEYAKDIRKWNPNIINWNNPPKNQIIYVDYPYDVYAAGTTWAPNLGLYEEPNEFNQKFSMNAFYASSFGTYSEVTSEQTVKSGQNFPVTFGFGFSTTNDEKIHFAQASVYWAQASKGSVKGNSETTTTEFSIPGEVGGNLYYQYFLKDYSLGLYSGYDFEKLNTFNTDQIVSGAPVTNIDNKIHYATLGVSKGFTLMDFKMNIKASISKTVASSTTGTKALTGTKYIVFYTYKPEGRFNFNVFFKHHELQGQTQLKIDRIGFSLGIMLF